MNRLKETSVISREDFEHYIKEAGRVADYKGFGAEGCDLEKREYWVAYTRQSLEEQSKNNRLPDYLLTCAKNAKKLSVVVPLQYVLYDSVTGEHLERPGMTRLRKLMAERRISGVILPALDRLSREPLHQQIFELEATHYMVQIDYADVPNGNDPNSQFTRTILAHAAKLVKLANRRNNRGGNIGRVVKGWVPAGKVPYGYKYRKEIDPLSGTTIKAWWDVDQFDPDGNPVLGTEAWVVTQVFKWIGVEGKSTYWVALELNKQGIKPRASDVWSPAKISFIVKKRCYTGKHAYNKASYVPNPDSPIKDITGEIGRTLRRAKPEDEHVPFTVPLVVPEWLWRRANEAINTRAQTKGKTKGRIEALFRGRVFCPRCGRRMTIRRDGQCPNLVYYICTSRSEAWNPRRCGASYIPVKWLDNLGWGNIAGLLKNPALILSQQRKAAQEDKELEKHLKLFDWQLKEAKRRIARIQQDWESGGNIYTKEEANTRILEERQKLEKAEVEKQKVQAAVSKLRDDTAHSYRMRRSLEAIRDANLEQATFEDKQRIVELLAVEIYPREDRTGAQLTCAFKLEPVPHASISIASPKL